MSSADDAAFGVGTYIDAVASDAPTPGGGSAAGVVAALGAALGAMTCEFTVGRPAFAAVEPEIRAALADLTELRRQALELAAADEAAFARYTDARALPRTTAAERAERQAHLDAALLAAADVPHHLADLSSRIIETLLRVARDGNPRVLSDALIGAHMTRAAAEAAWVNVRINAAIAPERDRPRLLRDIDERRETIREQTEAVIAVASEHLGFPLEPETPAVLDTASVG